MNSFEINLDKFSGCNFATCVEIMIYFVFVILLILAISASLSTLDVIVDGTGGVVGDSPYTEIYYERLLGQFGKAFNDHNADALSMMLDENAIFRQSQGSTDQPTGNEVIGRDAIKAAFETTFKNFPNSIWIQRDADLVVKIPGKVGEFRGLSTWVFQATRASDGAQFNTNGIDYFYLQDGLIKLKDAFRKDVPPLITLV